MTLTASQKLILRAELLGDIVGDTRYGEVYTEAFRMDDDSGVLIEYDAESDTESVRAISPDELDAWLEEVQP